MNKMKTLNSQSFAVNSHLVLFRFSHSLLWSHLCCYESSEALKLLKGSESSAQDNYITKAISHLIIMGVQKRSMFFKQLKVSSNHKCTGICRGGIGAKTYWWLSQLQYTRGRCCVRSAAKGRRQPRWILWTIHKTHSSNMVKQRQVNDCDWKSWTDWDVMTLFMNLDCLYFHSLSLCCIKCYVSALSIHQYADTVGKIPIMYRCIWNKKICLKGTFSRGDSM